MDREERIAEAKQKIAELEKSVADLEAKEGSRDVAERLYYDRVNLMTWRDELSKLQGGLIPTFVKPTWMQSIAEKNEVVGVL